MRPRNVKAREQNAGRKLNRENQRLSQLAIEIGLAVSQVLMTDYGFTSDQCNEVLTKVTAQAKQNRETPPREQGPV